MRKGGLFRRSLCAMALLAVAFLNVASVQSAVMQASGSLSGMDMSGLAEICHTAGPAQDAAKPVVHQVQVQKACPFCDVASNPPLCGTEVSVPSPSTIAWTSYAVQASLGARGPPAFTPNARGPPASTLTI